MQDAQQGNGSVLAGLTLAPLSDREFRIFQQRFAQVSGIDLSPSKKMLVASRLASRLRHHGLRCYRDYLSLIDSPQHADEQQVMIDLLTTNETYFFREPRHFDLLRDQLRGITLNGSPLRVWSAACSSGEEVWSIAMVLADVLGERDWEVLGSDLSQRVLAAAQRGQYPTTRIDGIPPDYLRRFCLKGVRKQAGTLLVDKRLRERARFVALNLNQPLPDIGMFQFIFLRNVLIYFDQPTKAQIVQRVARHLQPGGLLLVGHSETLHGIDAGVELIRPSVYRKRAAGHVTAGA